MTKRCGSFDENEEVFSDFDDSKDVDYEGSSKGGVSDDEGIGGSTEVEVNKSGISQ